MYSVMVNGDIAELTQVKVSAMPFNRTWPGHQRDILQSEVAYVLHLEENKPVEISVESDSRINDVKIRPLSKKICVDKNENRVDFRLEEHGQYTLEINGTHHAIHIFMMNPRSTRASGRHIRLNAANTVWESWSLRTMTVFISVKVPCCVQICLPSVERI